VSTFSVFQTERPIKTQTKWQQRDSKEEKMQHYGTNRDPNNKGKLKGCRVEKEPERGSGSERNDPEVTEWQP